MRPAFSSLDLGIPLSVKQLQLMLYNSRPLTKNKLIQAFKLVLYSLHNSLPENCYMRVAIYPNDRRSPHVYVIGQGHEAVFEMDFIVENVALRENYGFSRDDLARIHAGLVSRFDELLTAWESVHGSV